MWARLVAGQQGEKYQSWCSFNLWYKILSRKNISLSGITGVEAQRQNATTIAYGMVKNPLDTNWYGLYGNPYYWIIGNATSNVYTTTATTSVFTEWTLGLPKDFSITAGVGYSNMEDRTGWQIFMLRTNQHIMILPMEKCSHHM